MKAHVAIARYAVALSACVGIVGCDRVTKQVAQETLAGEPTRSFVFDLFRLSYSENTGSFLSLGADLPESVRFMLFVVGVGLLLVGLVVYAIRHRQSAATLIGAAVVVAGGVSNWVDRVLDGKVIDFLNVGIGPIRTGIFNVADMAILAGVLLLLLGDYSRSRNRDSGS